MTTISCRVAWKFTKAETGPTDRWDRDDGAAVKYSKDYYWANPVKAGHRGWLAYGPSDEYALGYRRHNSRKLFHRRWKTAEAAMDYIDRAFPRGTRCGDLARGHPGPVGEPGIPG